MLRVLVVGAGPTGLTAALELARRGVAVQIVEKRAAPSPLARAVGLLAPSLAILRPTGVAEAILREAIAFQAVRLHRGERLIARMPLNFDDRSRIWGLAQDRTEHHMIAGLSRLGVSVRFGEALSGLAADARGVTAHLPGGAERFDAPMGSTAPCASSLACPTRVTTCRGIGRLPTSWRMVGPTRRRFTATCWPRARSASSHRSRRSASA